MDKVTLSKFEDYKKAGYALYPHKLYHDISIEDYVKKYNGQTKAGDVYDGKSTSHTEDISEDLKDIGVSMESFKTKLPQIIHSLSGRVMLKRKASGKLVFYTIVEEGHEVQVMAKIDYYGDKDHFKHFNKAVSRGSYIWVQGYVAKTKKGELSIAPIKMEIMAPCYRPLPKHSGIADPDIRARNRHLDLIVNKHSFDTFRKRSLIVSQIRNYFLKNGYLDVETAILAQKAGGATAKPFKTHHNDLDQDMVMRISPELFLKQLVIGGLERVFEIGKQFRNETIDTTHNPEFTTLESYVAKDDYFDLMKMCEEMISEVVMAVNGSHKVTYHLTSLEDSKVEIDFTPPFKRVDMMDELEKHLGQLPKEWDSDEAFTFFKTKCEENKIELGKPVTLAKMIDKLVGHFIEPACANPTFITNHPVVMSPLAKGHRKDPRKTERFELFVCKFEVANAYTELNDPFTQKERFEAQSKDRDAGDEEVPEKDMEFVEALEYGLPPTAGFGMGIDRLTMLLTDRCNIQDVILFPARTEKTEEPKNIPIRRKKKREKERERERERERQR